jgi:hypothetical protein
VLLPHRTLPALAVIAGIRAALSLESRDPDLVAVQARRASCPEPLPPLIMSSGQSVGDLPPKTNKPAMPFSTESTDVWSSSNSKGRWAPANGSAGKMAAATKFNRLRGVFGKAGPHRLVPQVDHHHGKHNLAELLDQNRSNASYVQRAAEHHTKQ